jgi:hypothetical protein
LNLTQTEPGSELGELVLARGFSANGRSAEGGNRRFTRMNADESKEVLINQLNSIGGQVKIAIGLILYLIAVKMILDLLKSFIIS